MRIIGVVTVARSDYGVYLPILRRIQSDPGLKLHLIVGGMHLSPEFGLTVKAIEVDGFEVMNGWRCSCLRTLPKELPSPWG